MKPKSFDEIREEKEEIDVKEKNADKKKKDDEIIRAVEKK